MSGTQSGFRLLVVLGGIGLLFAMGVDAIAVVGRHIGWPLLGSIELVQTGALVAATTAIVIATIERTHAVVHFLIDRMPDQWRERVRIVNALLSALFFILLLVGSAWLALDLWHGHEESELVRIPYAPLRIAVILSCAAAALTFLKGIKR